MSSSSSQSGSSCNSSKNHATTQYHAQLYSRQKLLQKQQLQQDKPQVDEPVSGPRTVNPNANTHTLCFNLPNVYHTALRLTSEIEMPSWWSAVTDILTDASSFHATRVVLSVPQDPSDPWTVPWGLRAVYDKQLAYNQGNCPAADAPVGGPDYFFAGRTKHTGAKPFYSDRPLPFESQPEPLIHSVSIHPILRRGTTVVLSREYRHDLDSSSHVSTTHPSSLAQWLRSHDDDTCKRARWKRRDMMPRLPGIVLPVITTPCLYQLEEGLVQDEYVQTEILAGSPDPESNEQDDLPFESPMHDYDEYEQQQPSPWSQSPAPSPAMMDPDVNPFFQSPPDIDDDAFNPVSCTTYDDASIPFPPPVANVHSVVHIPLFHPCAPKDSVTATSHNPSHRPHASSIPIAILSFLTPIVPFPAVLLNHLSVLAPFLVATLSNALYVSAQDDKQGRRRKSIPNHGRPQCMTRPSHSTPHSIDPPSSEGRGDQSHLSLPGPGLRVPLAKTGESDHDTSLSASSLSDLTSSVSTQPTSIGASTASCKSHVHDHTSGDFPAGTIRRSFQRSHSHRVRRRRYSAIYGHIYPDHMGARSLGVKKLHSVRQLRFIVDGTPVHVFTCSSVTGRATWVNRRILQYTGRKLSDHLGSKWLSHMHPDDQANYQRAWSVASEQGTGIVGEYRLRRFDDVYRCFLWRVVPVRDLKGRIIHWIGSCTDIHDQREAKESTLRRMEIEKNERKHRLLAEAIPQIVFTFSPGVGLSYANGKWEDYSGQPFERTKGLGFISHVYPADRHKLQLPDLGQAKTPGILWQEEVRLLDGKGDYRWFLAKCVSVDELDEGQVQWFGTCTDIHDQKLLEHKLQEAHDAAQKSTESKTRFLSNMSHEIRTPLIGITGMLSFLLDTDLTPEQTDYAHTIQQSAESLLVVINDILDLSKVEAGMMKLDWESFSVVKMIEDANALLFTLAIQKGLELSYWVADDVPDMVVGDRVRLRQVLLNLIGNAIKFTKTGEVFIRCTLYHPEQESPELELLFEVIDTGTGFDADGEALMFKPFSQIDSSSTREHGGSGLGLVISRQLIELHGGEMKCKSQKGKGSTFYFTVKCGNPLSESNTDNEALPRRPSIPVDHPPPPFTPTLFPRSRKPSQNFNETELRYPPLASHDTALHAGSRDNTPLAPPCETPMRALVVSEWALSRDAMTRHVETILKSMSTGQVQVDTAACQSDAIQLIGEPRGYQFIVINLAKEQHTISVMHAAKNSPDQQEARLLVMTTPMQRPLIVESISKQEERGILQNCLFAFKPLKRSKLAWLFMARVDEVACVDTSPNLSDSPDNQVVVQKEAFSKMEADVSGKGYRVLLVEDNMVNEKVLTQYFNRVGLTVDVANNGKTCIDMYFNRPSGYYSIILCDLFMPIKDGYTTAREVREWELSHGRSRIPMVALSADVMSDVADKCMDCGFSAYISKPVNFAVLNDMIRKYLLPKE